jgi:RNA polymerase sigma-70 factor (ECF subfamily)
VSTSAAAGFGSLSVPNEKAVAPRGAADRNQGSSEVSDESLLVRIATSDQEALAILFRRYARMVWSIAERILRNEAEADDLVQDVFLLISRRASVFDSSKGTARSLIALMTYQRAFTRRRYLNARHCQAPIEAEERAAKAAAPALPLYDQSIEAHFGRERLRKALDEMSEDQRETLRLYFFEGYTLGEIAAHLGQSAGNVKHHYYRGLDKLRRNIPERQGAGNRS